MTIVKIFIASEKENFESDVKELEGFFLRLNNAYVKKDLYFSPIFNADYDDPEGISREITESRIAVFLTEPRADDDMQQTYEVAHSSYNKSGQPRIVVYTKQGTVDGNRRLGNGCRRLGEGNRRLGDENRRLGEGNRRIGDNNRRLGDDNRRLCYGNRRLENDDDQRPGEDNRRVSDGDRRHGEGNRRHGDDNRRTGDENRRTGKNVCSTG